MTHYVKRRKVFSMTDLNILNLIHFNDDATDAQKTEIYAAAGLWDTTSEAFRAGYPRFNLQNGAYETEQPWFRYDDSEWEAEMCLQALECAEHQYEHAKPFIAQTFGQHAYGGRYVAFVISRAFYAWLLDGWMSTAGVTAYRPFSTNFGSNRSYLCYQGLTLYVCKDDDHNHPYFCCLSILPAGWKLETLVSDELPQIQWHLNLIKEWNARTHDEKLILPHMDVTMPAQQFGAKRAQFTSDIYIASTRYRFPEDRVRKGGYVQTSSSDDAKVGVDSNVIDAYLESYRRCAATGKTKEGALRD